MQFPGDGSAAMDRSGALLDPAVFTVSANSPIRSAAAAERSVPYIDADFNGLEDQYEDQYEDDSDAYEYLDRFMGYNGAYSKTAAGNGAAQAAFSAATNVAATYSVSTNSVGTDPNVAATNSANTYGASTTAAAPLRASTSGGATNAAAVNSGSTSGAGANGASTRRAQFGSVVADTPATISSIRSVPYAGSRFQPAVEGAAVDFAGFTPATPIAQPATNPLFAFNAAATGFSAVEPGTEELPVAADRTVKLTQTESPPTPAPSASPWVIALASRG
jgi:hypothetical protein